MTRLLAEFQKMRLIREKNQLTLRQTRIMCQKNRVTKNIAATQKRYTSRITNIENMAKRFITQAKTFFQNTLNLGMNCGVQTNNYYGSNNFIMTRTQQLLGAGVPFQEQGSDTVNNVTVDAGNVQKMFAEMAQNGGYLKTEKDADGNVIYSNGWTEEQVAAFNQAKYQAGIDYNQQQMNINQASANYEQNIEIWKEANIAQIEDEQEAALEPLSYEETMLDLEASSIETQLENVKSQLEKYKSLASEEAKNTPSFGQ